MWVSQEEGKDEERIRQNVTLSLLRDFFSKYLCVVRYEQCVMLELKPMAHFLTKVLDQLISKDQGEIFAEPVDINEVCLSDLWTWIYCNVINFRSLTTWPWWLTRWISPPWNKNWRTASTPMWMTWRQILTWCCPTAWRTTQKRRFVFHLDLFVCYSLKIPTSGVLPSCCENAGPGWCHHQASQEGRSRSWLWLKIGSAAASKAQRKRQGWIWWTICKWRWGILVIFEFLEFLTIILLQWIGFCKMRKGNLCRSMSIWPNCWIFST